MTTPAVVIEFIPFQAERHEVSLWGDPPMKDASCVSMTDLFVTTVYNGNLSNGAASRILALRKLAKKTQNAILFEPNTPYNFYDTSAGEFIAFRLFE
jgi:hypothetical protein